jgi:hypothetical protein
VMGSIVASSMDSASTPRVKYLTRVVLARQRGQSQGQSLAAMLFTQGLNACQCDSAARTGQFL